MQKILLLFVAKTVVMHAHDDGAEAALTIHDSGIITSGMLVTKEWLRLSRLEVTVIILLLLILIPSCASFTETRGRVRRGSGNSSTPLLLSILQHCCSHTLINDEESFELEVVEGFLVAIVGAIVFFDLVKDSS